MAGDSHKNGKSGLIKTKGRVRPIFKDQLNKAIKEYLKQIEASPKDKRLHLKLGDLYLKNGEKEKAIDEYLKAGGLHAEEDLNIQAIAIYKKVVSIDPVHIEALHRTGTLYVKEGFLGNAKSCYERILQISPSDQQIIKALSRIEDSKQSKPVQTGMEKKESLRMTSEVSRVSGSSNGIEIPSPDKDLELHYHLGIGYKEMGLFDHAIPEFELASADPSMKFDCYIFLKECFKEKGDAEQSMKYLEWALKIKQLPKD